MAENNALIPGYNRESEQRAYNPRTRLIVMDGNKLYLPVAGRVEWFRSEQPDGRIVTGLDIDKVQKTAAATARVFRRVDGRLICVATGTACKTATDETGATDEIGKNYIECAETAAIGRALHYAGYGTQAAIGSADAAGLVAVLQNTGQQPLPHEPVTEAPVTGPMPASVAEALAYPCPLGDHRGMALGDIMKADPKYYCWLVRMSTADKLEHKQLQQVVLLIEQERKHKQQQQAG